LREKEKCEKKEGVSLSEGGFGKGKKAASGGVAFRERLEGKTARDSKKKEAHGRKI